MTDRARRVDRGRVAGLVGKHQWAKLLIQSAFFHRRKPITEFGFGKKTFTRFPATRHVHRENCHLSDPH
jgi:hypothetical protein